MNSTPLIAILAALVVLMVLAGCDRRDMEDGLARLPENLIREACLSADNCTIPCPDGQKRSNSRPYWCLPD